MVAGQNQCLAWLVAVTAIGITGTPLLAQLRDVLIVVRAQAKDERFLEPNLEDSARDLRRALRSPFREVRAIRVVEEHDSETEKEKVIADLEIRIVKRFVGDSAGAELAIYQIPGTGVSAGSISPGHRVVVVAELRVMGLEDEYLLTLVGAHDSAWTGAADDLSRQIQRWVRLNHERLPRRE